MENQDNNSTILLNSNENPYYNNAMYGAGASYGQNVPGQQPGNGYAQTAVKEETVTVGEWIAAGIIMLIPIVNLVMLFVWAFSGNVKKSKSNYFKAQLVLILIYIALAILGVVMFAGSFLSLM